MTQAHPSNQRASDWALSSYKTWLFLACPTNFSLYGSKKPLIKHAVRAVQTPLQHKPGTIDTRQLTWLCGRKAFSSEKMHTDGRPASLCCRMPFQGMGSGPWQDFTMHKPTAALALKRKTCTEFISRTEFSVFPEKTWRLEHGPWKSITEELTPSSTPGYDFYGNKRHVVKIFAMPSPYSAILSYVFLPFIPESTLHPFTFGCSSFFQHFPSCIEVGADPPCSDPWSAAQAPSACDIGGSVPREGAPFSAYHMVSCSPLFCPTLLSFCHSLRTAESLGGCG